MSSKYSRAVQMATFTSKCTLDLKLIDLDRSWGDQLYSALGK